MRAFNAGTANTIEQATAFYATPAFAARPGGNGQPLAMNAADITNIGRMLRALNAVFNIQMAAKRATGARQLGNFFGNGNALQLAKQKELCGGVASGSRLTGAALALHAERPGSSPGHDDSAAFGRPRKRAMRPSHVHGFPRLDSGRRRIERRSAVPRRLPLSPQEAVLAFQLFDPAICVYDLP